VPDPARSRARPAGHHRARRHRSGLADPPPTRHHRRSRVYASVAAGEITVEELLDTDWARISELVATYADLGLDAADASIIAIAERHHQTRIATLDHRDFRVVRPAHRDAFELVP